MSIKQEKEFAICKTSGKLGSNLDSKACMDCLAGQIHHIYRRPDVTAVNLILACTNWRSVVVKGDLEQIIPQSASNGSSKWHFLRNCKVDFE